jgi:hypothetical protein
MLERPSSPHGYGYGYGYGYYYEQQLHGVLPQPSPFSNQYKGQ